MGRAVGGMRPAGAMLARALRCPPKGARDLRSLGAIGQSVLSNWGEASAGREVGR